MARGQKTLIRNDIATTSMSTQKTMNLYRTAIISAI